MALESHNYYFQENKKIMIIALTGICFQALLQINMYVSPMLRLGSSEIFSTEI